MQPQQFTLPNGLRVILIDTIAFPTLTTIILFGAGSRHENAKNNGIAHFFEHILFKGTKKYPNAFAISSILEGMGAVNNAFTSKDHTGYWVKGTAGNFEKMLDILADMVTQPLLSSDEIEREKGVIVEEINMYEDSPQRKVGEIFESLLYKGTSLGMDIAGTKKTVTSFSKQTFLDYMSRYYLPKNAVLVVAGGINQGENYQRIIEAKFGKWMKNADLKDNQNIKDSQTKPEKLIRYKKTEQTHFTLGFRTFSFFDQRRYALSILGTILGGGMSSRLFIEVRERRGLCYYIHTGKEGYHDVGYIATQAGVTNDKKKIHEAIKIILNEHKKIGNGEVTGEELRRAKEMIKGRVLLSMEDSSHVATWYGTKLILEDKIETIEQVVKRIDAVTREEVVSLAKEVVVPERLNLALIGPFKKDDFKDSLEL